MPLWPVHTWLPDAHTEAPTAGSVILAGVLLKMGTYGFMKLGFPLFPDATQLFTPWLMTLAVVSIVYGACLALVQDDIKKIIAYSSISHLGYVMLGLLSLELVGIQGAIIQMVSHGLVAAGLFLLVGMIYDRCHTRELAEYGGLARLLPVYSVFFMIFTLASVGLPTTSGFTGEFLALMGAFTAAWPAHLDGNNLPLVLASVAVTGVRKRAISARALSTGIDSPVMAAWSTLDPPEITSPSSGIRLPLFTRISVPTVISSTGTSRSKPSAFLTIAVGGESLSRESTALRARPEAQDSSSSDREKRKTTAAASPCSPMIHAPVTATVMSTFMSRRSCFNAAKAAGTTSSPPLTVASAENSVVPRGEPSPSQRSSKPMNSHPPDTATSHCRENTVSCGSVPQERQEPDGEEDGAVFMTRA